MVSAVKCQQRLGDNNTGNGPFRNRKTQGACDLDRSSFKVVDRSSLPELSPKEIRGREILIGKHHILFGGILFKEGMGSWHPQEESGSEITALSHVSRVQIVQESRHSCCSE